LTLYELLGTRAGNEAAGETRLTKKTETMDETEVMTDDVHDG
jgi:hypothetical protein